MVLMGSQCAGRVFCPFGVPHGRMFLSKKTNHQRHEVNIPLNELISHPVSLSKISKKDLHWSLKREIADLVSRSFLVSTDAGQVRRGERCQNCALWIIYDILRTPADSSLVHKLRYAQFCHVRLCPLCLWRKSLAWRARFFQAWPLIEANFPKARYFHLVLTYPNCEVEKLRETLVVMNLAWKRMISRRDWPAMGFLRSVEVTRNKTDGTSHPHFHVLMMVNSDYFAGRTYMNIDEWKAYWASAIEWKGDYERLRHPYLRAVKGVKSEAVSVSQAVVEVAKYSVKFDHNFRTLLRKEDGQCWLRELDRQLFGTRAIATGGVIKKFIKDADISSEEMLLQDEIEVKKDIDEMWKYDWFVLKKDYFRTKILSELECNFWLRDDKNVGKKVCEDVILGVQ